MYPQYNNSPALVLQYSRYSERDGLTLYYKFTVSSYEVLTLH